MSVLSDTIKGFLICFCIFLLWSAGCFFAGYILSNSRAVEHINNANREIAEQQQRYDDLIAETEERIRVAEQTVSDIREQLLGKVSDNGKASEELSKLIGQIRKQKLSL